MNRRWLLANLLILSAASCFSAAEPDENIVFRSDVALVRVDAQVLDRSGRAVSGLNAEDFVLFDSGKQLEIRNFGREDMPVDVLLLLDVSGSMRPHVERIANASQEAMRVLGSNDRVAIMVFDRETRVRMPFRRAGDSVARELDILLQQETFDGGTDITRALLDGASYVGRESRRDARRAVVILTDDQTERNRDEEAVGRALTRADAVLMALLTPDALSIFNSGGGMGGGYPGGGGGLGGPLGGPLGGIIFGRRGPYGGNRGPLGGGGGPVIMTPSRTHSAGTAAIARSSGGDSMRVDEGSALQDTLERIRQRYALYFYLPEGASVGQERSIDVQLAANARRRYPEADVRFRQQYLAPGKGSVSEPAVLRDVSSTRVDPAGSSQQPSLRRRRPAVDDTGGWRGPAAGDPKARAQTTSTPVAAQTSSDKGGWRRSGENASPAVNTGTPAVSDETPKTGGWRKIKPGEQP